MKKRELVARVAAETGLTREQARHAVDALIESISRSLKRGDQVTIEGFGTFAVRERAARTGRNPRTGDPLIIKAEKRPYFKARKALKMAVESGPNTGGGGPGKQEE